MCDWCEIVVYGAQRILSYFRPLRFLPALLLLTAARLPFLERFAGEGATDSSSVSGLSLSSKKSADGRFLDVVIWDATLEGSATFGKWLVVGANARVGGAAGAGGAGGTSELVEVC